MIEQTVQAGHADVGQSVRSEAVSAQHGIALLSDGEVSCPRGDQRDAFRPR